ncbi:hypothetical protein [Mesotoga prima]|nr:hypothetical protein [Mesotoga prima]
MKRNFLAAYAFQGYYQLIQNGLQTMLLVIRESNLDSRFLFGTVET